MILNKDTILAEVKFPLGLDKFQVNSHSIDLRVSEDIELQPGLHHIAKTIDIVTLPKNIMAVVFPRSSLNRMNVTLDPTGIVDCGYSGTLVLPLTAHSKTFIRKGTRIASLIFYRAENVSELRQSKYHNSDGAYKPDKTEEASLIEKGCLDDLKKDFAIILQ